MIPEWLIILLALVSAALLAPYFGGIPKVLSRLWIAGFYAFIWLGPDPHDTAFLASLSRIGLVLLFITDIMPPLIERIKEARKK